MGAITTTTRAQLPDTLTEIGLGLPIAREVYEHVREKLVLPVLELFDAGRTITDAKVAVAMQRAYITACVGFMPEAYPLAVSIMCRDRVDRWRPTPAECREWLQKAEDEICARTGRPRQVHDQTELRRAMLGALCLVGSEKVVTYEPGSFGKKKVTYLTYPTTWDRASLGPMPTEPGCRLSAAAQQECWRIYFQGGVQRLRLRARQRGAHRGLLSEATGTRAVAAPRGKAPGAVRHRVSLRRCNDSGRLLRHLHRSGAAGGLPARDQLRMSNLAIQASTSCRRPV